MTRIFDPESGQEVSVTAIQVGSNYVCQVKTDERDGYSAVQLGFDPTRDKLKTKPELGHMKKNECPPLRVLKEFDAEGEGVKPGNTIGVEAFEGVEKVNVTGISKGRGFSGTVRRHNFSIGRKTHGNRNQRRPGSIGASADPSRVFPGQKMPGQYGATKTTIKGLQVMGLDKEKELILVRGGVPGKNKGIVYIKMVKKAS